MSLPPPQFGTASFYVPGLRREIKPVRRRLGWGLITLSVLVIGLLLGTAGVGIYRLFNGLERTSTPGSVTVSCTAGDQWRIGPLVGRSSSVGPLTVNEGTAGRIGRVVASSGGASVPIEAMSGGATEQFTVDGATYLAVATFECPGGDDVTVDFVDDTGSEVAVFPSFRRLFELIALAAVGGLLACASGGLGIALAVRHRRSLAVT